MSIGNIGGLAGTESRIRYRRLSLGRRANAKFFVGTLLVTLAACSPYSFQKEVTSFSSGVDHLSSGFANGFSALASDRQAKLELDLTTSRSKVSISSSCFAAPSQVSPGAAPCELFATGTTPPALTDIEKTRNRTTAALNALKNYADALAAVTNAADRTAFNNAASQLSGSVGALAKTAGAVAPGASIMAPVTTNVLAWLVGTALDQQRFDTLKAAVNLIGTASLNGKSTISVVATTMGAGLYALSQARQEILVSEIQVLSEQLKPSLSEAAYQQNLANAERVLAILDGLRETNPSTTAEALVKAHDALVAAVNDPGRNYANLMMAVDEFADQAAALDSAIIATTTPTKKGS